MAEIGEVIEVTVALRVIQETDDFELMNAAASSLVRMLKDGDLGILIRQAKLKPFLRGVSIRPAKQSHRRRARMRRAKHMMD